MDPTTSLRAYYEEEARRGTRIGPKGLRVRTRTTFIERLGHEGRTSILDIGAGPGTDGDRFVAAGLRYIGIELAVGNARLAAARGLHVVPASLTAPPLRDATFEAAWSMSVLMHLPSGAVSAALPAMLAPLTPGAPMVLGLWGGPLGEVWEDGLGSRRLFSLRTVDENLALFAEAAEVERHLVWDVGPAGWEYQIFHLRTATRTEASQP